MDSTIPRKLRHDLTIKFLCASYLKEEPIINKADIPLNKSGLFLSRANLEKGATYSILFKYGNTTILSVTEQLPFDWKNPLDWAFSSYAKVDKKIVKRLPWIGPVIEGFLPDAKWNFDLWYDIKIDNEMNMNYKIHFGPTPTIEVRKKYESHYNLAD